MLDVDDLKQIVADFKSLGCIPSSPSAQLRSAIEAIFNSWHSARANKYRHIHNLPGNIGAAVIVQAMVYGNVDSHSGSGVLITRDPTTGERDAVCEYYPRSLGSDLETGLRTPHTFDDLRREHMSVHGALINIADTLETRFKDVQVGSACL